MIQSDNNTPLRLLAPIAGIVLLLTGWELLVRVEYLPEILFPSPVDVLHQLWEMANLGSFWRDLTSTAISWLLAVTLGTLLGGLAGIVLGVNRFVWHAFEPIVEFARSLPSIVLVPLVSLFVGVGFASRLSSGVLAVSVIIVSSTGSAIRTATLTHRRLSEAWGWDTSQWIRFVLLPSGLSELMVGLRTSIPIGLIVVIAADMLVATDSGVGRIVMDSLAVFDTRRLFAAIMVIGLLGYVASLVSDFVGRKTIHWAGK
jgi:ABC-type nitrate/sulfonate/bicarbonate transport system permease component